MHYLAPQGRKPLCHFSFIICHLAPQGRIICPQLLSKKIYFAQQFNLNCTAKSIRLHSKIN
jgi:hypothetical protein